MQPDTTKTGPRAFYDSLRDLAAVQRLIDQEVRESTTLEYKGGHRQFNDKAKNEVAKDVSAMANSEGGVLIYGVETDPGDKTKPKRIDGLFMGNVEIFDQLVNQNVRREIQGLDKKVLKEGETCVLVVHVPKSVHSPHQSLVDHKYYYRAGTVSRPMEHHLVELHFGRRLGPVLTLEARIVEERQSQPPMPGFSDEIHLLLTLTNEGQRSGHHVEGILTLPNESLVRIRQGHPALVNIGNLNPEVRQQIFGLAVGKAAHPGMRVCVANLYLRLSSAWLAAQVSESVVSWTLFAEDMDTRNAGFHLAPAIMQRLALTVQPVPTPAQGAS